jgi:aspartate aminotransferase
LHTFQFRTSTRPSIHPSSIFNLTATYKADPHPSKVNLGVGAYRDDDNKPWVLPVIKKVPCLRRPSTRSSHSAQTQATEVLLNDPVLDHEYLPITGLPEFTNAAARLILSPQSLALKDARVARSLNPTKFVPFTFLMPSHSVQTISGTGANHLGALFLSRFYTFNGPKQVYLSDPTWSVFSRTPGSPYTKTTPTQ